MPEIKITENELKIVLMIKKKELSYSETKNFLDLFCFLLDNNFFICKGGEKIVRFDKDGKLRQLETRQIDWKS